MILIRRWTYAFWNMYKPSGLGVVGQVIEVFVSLLFHVVVYT